jgi:multicomponent Na+:H+ antiporter subunit E
MLLTFWLIISGSFDLQHILVGVPVGMGVTALYGRMFGKMRVSGIRKSRPFVLLDYAVSLVVEIVKANIHVAGIVLSPKMHISPGMIKYRTKLKSDVGKVLLATSITLTPGTLTVDLEGDEFLIHALTRDMALGIANSPIEEKIGKMEG